MEVHQECGFESALSPTILRRYLAVLLDNLFGFGVIFTMVYTLPGDEGAAAATRVSLMILFVVLYEPLCTSFLCTLGQKSMGIRVRNIDDGHRIKVLQAYVRVISKYILGFISFFSIPFSKGRRGLHDMLSGSIVVAADSLESYGDGQPRPWPDVSELTTVTEPDLDILDREGQLRVVYAVANECLVCRGHIGAHSDQQQVAFPNRELDCRGNIHLECLPGFEEVMEEGQEAERFGDCFPVGS